MSGFLEPRPDLRSLEGYHSPQVDVPVRLNTNESPFPPPDEFIEEWLSSLRDVSFNRYPDRGYTELREALAAHVGQPAERVFCANGSNEVLQTILLTYGGAERCAAMFEPTYALHDHIARLTGTAVITGERSPDFRIDPGVASALLEEHKPAITFVCSPNNPTGSVEDRPLVEVIAAAAGGCGGLLVVDEAYGEFSSWTAFDLVDEALPLAVVRTYSKVWSMAAFRLGFCVAPAWMVEELEKVALPYRLPVPTQLAGVIALQHGAEMRERVSMLVAERERIAAVLAGVDRLTVYPSGANFLLMKVHGDGHAVWEALLRRGVLVRDFSRRQRLAECLRVTVGAPQENDRFLAALEEALQEAIT